MNKEDNFGRLLMLLLITLCICLGLYYLPDNMFGQKIKKVDLLSDLRVKTQSLSMDSLRKQLEQPDTLEIDSVALRDSIIRSTGIDSTALALRDSLYNIMYSVQGADSLGTHIEDYSVGHIGLKRFFTALKNRETTDRCVSLFWVTRLLRGILSLPTCVLPCRKSLAGVEWALFLLLPWQHSSVRLSNSARKDGTPGRC